MSAFIFIDDIDGIRFWNRRKKEWQEYLTKSCVYPTMKGAQPVMERMFNSSVTDHFRPLNDWLGCHCLADFAAHDYRKSRVRM